MLQQLASPKTDSVFVVCVTFCVTHPRGLHLHDVLLAFSMLRDSFKSL
jgi:hypothetical protein